MHRQLTQLSWRRSCWPAGPLAWYRRSDGASARVVGVANIRARRVRSAHGNIRIGAHLAHDRWPSSARWPNDGAVPEWRDIAAEMRTRHRRSVPVFHPVEEKLEHVAAGHGIVVLPLSTAVFYTRPGIAYSHVSDVPPNQVCLAWDATRCSRLIQDVAAIAAGHPPVASRAASHPPGRRRQPRSWLRPGPGGCSRPVPSSP
jgi:hypothetical protein